MATVVALHAHPDDEVLLTGGTLARLADEGHRVVIVVACDGVVRADATGPALRSRLDELRASACVLGAARVEHLGYADTGHGPELSADPPGRTRFGNVSVGEAAGKLADLLRAEHADLLLSYDPRGGYGHRDHVRVHHVGARAAELTGVRVLEATLPREPVVRVFHVLRVLRLVRRYDPEVIATSYSPRSAITHRLDVRRYAARKRAALAAHRSQTHGTGRAAPLFRALAALPSPIFGLLLGREWFVDPAGNPTRTTSDNLPG
ncbi:PIG-L deacetylase family protein [Kibdelosporangium phytohabitans]|uniref:GlcNAc-PI de-N-acetylase n=1 Tax=Kibdelosporangium phytohabitans TaxID=860235 RepID=A0A0N7F474_9PSEU|nr:PIG-L family deacetylase [Kibdelosporangium phytohabitans]ALG10639.1 GlcNAc-PI de-N-acetylase [Kibdelosporangium phytohabitans]MBE1461758.1 LmbE family N-acetylglucosaminyl deacetylase [Kibdelosporangium phytohabitans]